MNQSTDLNLGPYGVPYWSKSEGRWIGRLTDEGKRFVEENLKKCDHKPITLLLKTFPAMAIFAIRREGFENVNQDCLIGVVEAALRFDPGRGFKFETFAANQIRCVVQRYTWIPAYGMSYRSYKSRTRYGSKARPFTPDYNFATEHDIRTGFSEQEYFESERYVTELLKRLPAKQREVVCRYAIQGDSMTDIGESCGVTKQRISQIFSDAKKKLEPIIAGETCQK